MKKNLSILWAIILLAVTLATNPGYAQNVVVTYQGRVSSGGTNFTGAGLFKFALSTGVNSNHTATATATIAGTFVNSITLASGGNGYTTTPTVSISGGGGMGATATAILSSNGVVTNIVINTSGSNYTSPPFIAIIAPPPSITYTSYWSNDGTSVAGSEPATPVTVAVSNGLFTIGLGDTTTLNMMALGAGVFANSNLQVQIWFNDGTNGSAALNPPTALAYAPYAAYALNASSASNVLGSITTTQLVGTLPVSALPAAVVTNNAIGLNLAGTFTGNGTGVTNVNAVTLNGIPSTGFWRTNGNTGANPTNGAFIGNADNLPLVLKVNGGQVWRADYANDALTYGTVPNVTAGSTVNIISNGYVGGVISGGGYNSAPNRVGGNFSAVLGGFGNTASGLAAIAGGNTAISSGTNSIALGSTTTASGFAATALGFATIASGYTATALGSYAAATNSGSFVWGDASVNQSTYSTNNNSVTMRASGGYRLYSKSDLTAGVFLAAGGTSWSTISDRNAKKNFQPVDNREVLEKLAAVPVQRWNYKWEADTDTPNIGPMAQDFKHAFFPGRDDTSISTLEFDGVALAAIQGLKEKFEVEAKAKDTEIAEMKQQIAELKAMVEKQARMTDAR